MIQLQERQRKLTHLRHELDLRLSEVEGASSAAKAAFRSEELPRRQSEIKSLFEELQSDSQIHELRERNRLEMKAELAPGRRLPFGAGDSGVGRDTRSLGQRFVESEAFRGRQSDTKLTPIETKFEGINPQEWQGGASDGDFLKATLSTTNGFAPFIPRSNRVVEMGQIKPVIADLIPQDTTEVPGGKYIEEVVFTNNAAIVPEGTTKPEAALRFEERLFGMAKIAVTLPVTDEQLADVPQIRGIIDNRLSLMVRQKEEGYLLSNTALNGFDGFLTKSGVQTRALGADPIPTAVLDLMTSIEFEPGFASVTGIVMNPRDWLKYVTYQTSTGAYVVGNPATEAAITQMWGMPIIRTNRMPQGKLLLGDFLTYSLILRRLELIIKVGYINTDFVDNIQRVLAEERVVLQIFRSSAFGVLTGL